MLARGRAILPDQSFQSFFLLPHYLVLCILSLRWKSVANGTENVCEMKDPDSPHGKKKICIASCSQPFSSPPIHSHSPHPNLTPALPNCIKFRELLNLPNLQFSEL